MLALAVTLVASRAEAQGLPAYAPINPFAQARSGVSFEPYHVAKPGAWSTSYALDYGSAIDFGSGPGGANMLLDLESLRATIGIRRDLSPRVFLLGDIPIEGSYAGFLDGFLHWYHSLIGITMPEREQRPRDAFAYTVTLPGRSPITRKPSDLYLGDVRVGAGFRYGKSAQTVVALTLPTTTASAGYGRGTVSLNVLNTVRAQLGPRWVYEGSLNFGTTPKHGDLADVQRTTFAAASSGLRFRFWGRQSLYANFLYHSPYYHDTSLKALDGRDLSLDFGWLLATRNGRELKIGMTEDMEPAGPAIDIVFRLGVLR